MASGCPGGSRRVRGPGYSDPRILRCIGESICGGSLLESRQAFRPSGDNALGRQDEGRTCEDAECPSAETLRGCLAHQAFGQSNERTQPFGDTRLCLDGRTSRPSMASHASRWKPFIAHRVSEIQSTLPSECWSYVQTASNPADLATRGINPAELLSSELWWHGPSWLQQPQTSWPRLDAPQCTAWKEEQRAVAVLTAHADIDDEPLSRSLSLFPSLFALLRATAYCFRFVRNAKGKDPKTSGFLTQAELQDSLTAWVRYGQSPFHLESEALRAGRSISVRSTLRTLQPFLDEKGLLRVGGRLHAAFLPYAEKHPLILPKTGRFTWLIVQDAHAATMHGSPQLTRSHLLRKYWIVQGGLLTRRIVRECVRCTCFRQETGQQRIGQFPSVRLRPSQPFLSSGVDFAGPIKVRASKGPGRTALKGYISLFICLATRVIHLEAVSDLSTEAFIAAYHRFTSRRGRCAELMSDNGTNFRGADQELRRMLRAASDAGSHLANEGTTWTFIPLHAPHFGGIWEAGVRSTKHHLRRIVADHALTFEELSTVLCQIEACLNSRPLYPLSSDPSDLTALTPGHFLVGEALTSIPETITPDDLPASHNRWRLLTNMRDHFWRRWSKDYLHHLQQSSKWLQTRSNIREGTLVLIKDDLLPPQSGRWAGLSTSFPDPMDW
ncbi:uncharacterized protein LOC114946191 [Nylanderia fulva]|uniref:uncharacterized protein LOC114946191 n=1 Tax=Nylanderia fulva TaxID=613905 RepID=UPI0010FB9142|nr:uncharacterized protein LOC114946191 [Nylanderia fulva]